MPAQVYLMYTPEQWGRSASGMIEVGKVGALNTVVPTAQIARVEKILAQQ
jgi:hypothetical protein